MKRQTLIHTLIYGLCGGVLIVILKLVEFRFLVVQHSIEIYGGIVAVIFASLGIWLGVTRTRKEPDVVVKEVPVLVTEEFIRTGAVWLSSASQHGRRDEAAAL